MCVHKLYGVFLWAARDTRYDTPPNHIILTPGYQVQFACSDLIFIAEPQGLREKYQML